MTSDQLADLSRVLYSPTTLLLYLGAAFVYLYALTTTVGRTDERDQRGRRARQVGTVLAVAGMSAHLAHEIVRGLAQERLPLGNMFEVSSLMAFVGVVAGWAYLQFARKRPELSGFVFLVGALVLGMAMLMYADPGPLMPILDTWWRPFHVSVLVGAMGIFAAAFMFMALYLMRDSMDRQLGRMGIDPSAPLTADDGDAGTPPSPGSGAAASASATATATADAPVTAPGGLAARRQAVREAIPAGRLALGTFVGTGVVSWVWWHDQGWSSPAGVARFLAVNLAMVGAAFLARRLTPYLPAKETLDGIAHRTVAFAFIMWTVGTILGAMWAEVSWGRFWGWDPKETGAFLTWVAYAGYLHARATHGVRGRRAAWIGIGAFVVLMATYLVANYVVVGLHSYADL